MTASVVSRSKMKIIADDQRQSRKVLCVFVAWCEKKRWTLHRDKGVWHRYHLKIHHYRADKMSAIPGADRADRRVGCAHQHGTSQPCSPEEGIAQDVGGPRPAGTAVFRTAYGPHDQLSATLRADATAFATPSLR